jgi:hypothetical protein
MLAVSHSGSALDGPADGDARRWRRMQHLSVPRPDREVSGARLNPEGYLYWIMRKESGFNPHDLYADAQGPCR